MAITDRRSGTASGASTSDRLGGVPEGLGMKAPVRVATTANITLNGLQSIDGVTVAAGDRVLVKDQTLGRENWIYDAAAGNWTRSVDAIVNGHVVEGTRVYVNQGSTNGNTEWVITTDDDFVVGTNALTIVNTITGMIAAGTATQAEAEAGTVNTKIMTPLRSKQAIDYGFVTTRNLVILTPEQYGAVGDGTTDDTAAFAALGAAATAAGRFHIEGSPGKTYCVWPTNASATANDPLMVIDQTQGGVINWNGSALHSKYLGALSPVCIDIRRSTNIAINGYRHTADRGKSTTSVVHVNIDRSSRIALNGFYMNGGAGGIRCARSPGSANARSYLISFSGEMVDVYYPTSFQFDGDDVTGVIKTTNAGRTYFPYGCSNHLIDIDSTDPSSNDVLFAAYGNSSGETKTTGIKLKYTNRRSATMGATWLYLISNQYPPATTGYPTRIEAEIDLDVVLPSNASELFAMDSYNASGAGAILGDAAHIVDLKLRGVVEGDAPNAVLALLDLATSARGWGNLSKVSVAVDLRALDCTKGIKHGIGTLTRIDLARVDIPSGAYAHDTGSLGANNLHIGVVRMSNLSSTQPGMQGPTHFFSPDGASVYSAKFEGLVGVLQETVSNGVGLYWKSDDNSGYISSLGTNHPLVLGVNTVFTVQLAASGQFTPVTDNTGSLGTSALRWADLRAVLANVTTGLSLGTAGSVQGALTFYSAADTDFITLSGPSTLAASFTLFLPSSAGSSGQMLTSLGAGNPMGWSTATFPSTATSTGTILRADGTNWVATTATYPATSTVNQLLYSSSANVIAGLATANTGALVTSSSGVPSLTSGSTANRLLRTDGTTVSFAQVALATDVSGQLPLANGGTNASLTASLGGIFYSTASAGAVLAGTATARQMLQSGASAAPAWSTTTWPATTSVDRILYSSSASVIGEITTANNGVLITSSGGTPSISSTIPTATQDNITRTGTLVSGATGAGFTVALGTSTLTGDLPFANLTQGTARSVLAVAGNSTADFASLQSSAAGQILNSTASAIAWTATPTFGVAGTTLGTVSLTGNTSGTILITPQATAGSPTLTLPNTTGTFAVGASSPLALSATTGNLTITGAAGQVLAGSGPAFTATPTLGVAGATVGTLAFANATSGSITLSPVAGALGSVTLTLPARTDTLVTLAGTEALTNKTYNGNTWTAGTGTLAIAAGKTFTSSNTLTLTGTDSTSFAFPSGSGTVVTLDATQTLTSKTLTAPTINGGTATALTGLALRDTSAAFDVTIAATSTSATLNAGRALTLDMGNVAHTLKFGTATSTVTFPTGTVTLLANSLPVHCCGRLTLSSAVPVMVSDVTAATTIYWTPYLGSIVPIYDGTIFVPTICAELSNVTSNSSTGSAGPAAVTTNSNYDLFVWSNSGTPTLTRGPLWTSDTGRGTGAGTTELQMLNGVWTNKVAITNGPGANLGTYVGTVRSNGSSQIDWKLGSSASGGGAAWLGVWNMHNRVRVEATVIDSTASWTYASNAAWRAINNSTTNRVSFVRGLNEDGIAVIMSSMAQGTLSDGAIAIGLDTATTSTSMYAYFQSGAVNYPVRVHYNTVPGLGFHYVQPVELAFSANTITLSGTSNYEALQLSTTM